MNILDKESAVAQTYAGAFSRMSWAFLFLGISIGPTITTGSERFTIDLLPDFVGYLLIASAANRLLVLHAGFRSVRNLAFLLVFLALPLCIQYQVETSKSGNVTFWLAPLPLWPFLTFVPLLHLVLVWKVCGITADLARHANEWSTERSALTRRNLYIGIKILTFVGAIIVLASGAAELIVPAVVVGLLLGIVMVCLMIGLMSRSRRICLTTPLLADIESTLGIRRRSETGIWTVRVIMAFGIFLPLLLLVGVVYYWVDWQSAREELRSGGDSADFQRVAHTFFEDIKAERLDAAYQATTTGFKKRMSKEQFEKLVKRYPAIKCGPGTDIVGVGGGGGWDHGTERYTVKDAEGKHIQVSVVVRQEDSIFHRRPPLPKVDEFTVSQLDPNAPWNPFGRDFPP
jgi:hypothetical protein